MSQAADSGQKIENRHRYFVAMYKGAFATEAAAVAGAEIPPGSIAQGEFQTASGSGKGLAFRPPPRKTDIVGLAILIIEPLPNGTFSLWLSATDLARATQAEANHDVENFEEIGGGVFRVFERKLN